VLVNSVPSGLLVHNAVPINDATSRINLSKEKGDFMIEKSTTPQTDKRSQRTDVVLTFDRLISEEELKEIQLQHHAIAAQIGGVHRHDHFDGTDPR